MTGTFKVYLTAEQWALVCANSLEIAEEVAKQQPEMFATIAVVTEKSQPESAESPVANDNAHEAVEKIANMRSKDKLHGIADNDHRVTVQEAAKKRLAEIDNA